MSTESAPRRAGHPAEDTPGADAGTAPRADAAVRRSRSEWFGDVVPSGSTPLGDAVPSGRGRAWRTALEARAKEFAARVAGAGWGAPVVDVGLAAGLFVAFWALSWGPVRHQPGPLLVAQLALVAPLSIRRRAPMVAFGCVAAVAFVQWLVDLRTPADGALLIALYTVAAYRDRRRMVVAFAVLELGVVLATARWSEHERAAASFISLSAMAVAAAVIGSNMRARRERLAFLEDRAVRLERERDQREQLAVAGERARIAREMHDVVTHNLSVMVALADGAVFAQPRSPERAMVAMRQVSATGRQAITDMRRFLGVLRSDEPDALRHPMPGIGQLDGLVEQVRAAGLPTRLEVAGEPSVVPAAAQLTVYRLVQEALTNTMKHTPPGTRAEVRVTCAVGTVLLTVTDDGAGTVPPDPGRTPGHGLPGMRERAAAYGGRLSAGPRDAGGWQVTARLDLTTPETP